MKTKLLIQIFLFLIVFCWASPDSKCAVKFHQANQINKDGSLSIKFTYSANESDVTKGNKMIGNLPFSEEAVKKFFSSPDSHIEKNTVYVDPNDKSIVGVSVHIEIRDINRISGIMGLRDFRAGWQKEDSGMVFTLHIPVSFMNDNLIDTYQFILTSDDEVKSSNGLFRDNSYNWFIFKDKMDPRGAFFTATINATENNNSISSSSKDENESGNLNEKTVETKPDDKKSCGLFSIELPIIILFGFCFSHRRSVRFVRFVRFIRFRKND